MLVQSYLFFDGRCEEAIEFYRGALDAEVNMLMRFKDNPEPEKTGPIKPGTENKVMHAQMRIGDTVIMASDGRCTGQPNFQGSALAVTVARQITDARTGGSLRVMKLRASADHRDATAASRLSCEGPHEFSLAVAVDPREADNLALLDPNRDVGKAGTAQLRHVENDACAAIVTLGRELAVERSEEHTSELQSPA